MEYLEFNIKVKLNREGPLYSYEIFGMDSHICPEHMRGDDLKTCFLENLSMLINQYALEKDEKLAKSARILKQIIIANVNTAPATSLDKMIDEQGVKPTDTDYMNTDPPTEEKIKRYNEALNISSDRSKKYRRGWYWSCCGTITPESVNRCPKCNLDTDGDPPCPAERGLHCKDCDFLSDEVDSVGLYPCTKRLFSVTPENHACNFFKAKES